LPKRYWWVILTYIIAQLSVLLFAPLLYILLPLTEIQAIVYWNIFSFAVALLITLRLLRKDLTMEKHRDAATSSGIILWSIVGFFLSWVAQVIAVNIEINLLGIDPGSENTAVIMQIAEQAPLFLIIPIIFAPILEELIFRKIIFGTLHKRINFIFAALISSAIFGIIHQEPEHILIYSSMGFVFAYLYVRTKRIIVPIIVHMALNTASVIVQLTFDVEQLEQIQTQMIIFGGL